MLRAIEFKDKRFETKDDYNFFDITSDNMIILCNNYRIMHSLTDEIINTVNGKAEYNNYDCDENDIGKAKSLLCFKLQRIIEINEQKITLALELSIIYKANKISDIWLFDCNKKDGIYKEYIYPIDIFKGSCKTWNKGKGKDEIYKNICNGQYGTYDGNWIK